MSDRVSVSARVDADVAGRRVDRFLADDLALFPRSQIAHRDVVIRVDGRACKPSHRLKAGPVLGN